MAAVLMVYVVLWSPAVCNHSSDSHEHPVIAQVLTKDHKPEDPEETKQIKSYGEISFMCATTYLQ